MSPTPTPFQQPPPPGGSVLEIVIGSILALLGVWSLVRWARRDFPAASLRERVLSAVHVTTRVGLWFAFAGFFFGLALVDEPGHLTWYVVLLLVLAGLQLITAVALRQSTDRSDDGPEAPAGSVR
jgi:hypothetical protein